MKSLSLKTSLISTGLVLILNNNRITRIQAISRRISSSSLHIHRHHLILQHRNFINTRLKWVRDPFLDEVVEREKNLLPCLSLKSLLLSSPSLSLPLSHPSLLHFHSPNPTTTTPTHLFHKYPSLFRIFRPHSPTSTSLPHHVKLTPQFLSLHHEEQHIHDSMSHKHLAAHRLLKFLMLTRASRLPLSLVDAFKFDLGLPTNYLLHLVSYFPDYVRVCQLSRDGPTHGNSESPSLGLELVSWNMDFAVPAILNEFQPGDGGGTVEFPLSFAPGFDLQKKVKHWVDEWQSLPYISPYEDAFHLAPASDQADKWAVAVLHELLSLLVSKKTEVKNVMRLGDYLGFGLRFKKALAHHPGIFYVSNKIRTQTVLLRQAFRKHWLLDNHPLMGMRHRYIYLMSKSRKRNKFTKLSTKHNLRVHGIAN